jgi:hypothetical protein
VLIVCKSVEDEDLLKRKKSSYRKLNKEQKLRFGFASKLERRLLMTRLIELENNFDR